MAPKQDAMVHLVVVLVAVPLLSLMTLPFSSLALTQNFCVGNLSLPDTPSGYPCKPKALVSSDDFYSDALAKPGPVLQPFSISLASATVKQFPGLNGLGLAATRVDIQIGGVVPLHTHPEASEIIFLVEGAISAGFISADSNKVYEKRLGKGDLFVFPQGLLHYQYNVGNSTAIVLAVYSNPNPGLQITDFALFGNTMPADLVTKLTFIILAEVKRLKDLFGIASLS